MTKKQKQPSNPPLKRNDMKLKCPKCSEDVHVEMIVNEPDGESVCLTLETESELFMAESIGKAILSFKDVLEGVSNNMGVPARALVQFIEIAERKFTIRLRLAVVEPAKAAAK